MKNRDSPAHWPQQWDVIGFRDLKRKEIETGYRGAKDELHWFEEESGDGSLYGYLAVGKRGRSRLSGPASANVPRVR
jgi:hypothetical protein